MRRERRGEGITLLDPHVQRHSVTAIHHSVSKEQQTEAGATCNGSPTSLGDVDLSSNGQRCLSHLGDGLQLNLTGNSRSSEAFSC